MANEPTGGAPDTEQLYDLCKTTEKGLERIATGLAGIGAGPEAVKAFEQMADVVEKVCNGLAKSMKEEEPPEPAPTMDSAADEMMAERAAPA